MKELIAFFYNYFRQEQKIVLLLCSCFIAVLITFNYTTGLNRTFIQYEPSKRLLAYFFLFAFAFIFPYLLQFTIKKTNIFRPFLFLFLVLAGAFLFAIKITFNGFTLLVEDLQYPWDEYIWIIAKWPWKLVIIIIGILLLTYVTNSRAGLPGLRFKNLNWKPYLILLSCMIPLILLASTQQDFLETYPKVKTIAFVSNYNTSPIFPILFELCYGLDFFTIELFFRGFLVLCFLQFVGKDAILPMAVFYCTIHFGKPLGECISSYFGGILLGIVTYHTHSIFGGLIVHLGIAWMMEVVAGVAAWNY